MEYPGDVDGTEPEERRLLNTSHHPILETLMPSSSTTASNDDTATIDFLRAPFKETQALDGGWLQLVKAHHLMIEQAFDALIDDSGRNFSRCAVLHKRLSYLLTAHAVAEENVLYPALAMCNLQSDSDRLYLDQAHAKVMNALLDISDEKCGPDWLEKASQLRTAVLRHAKEDEEGNLYPQLAQALDATTATKLDMAYRREFLTVKPM